MLFIVNPAAGGGKVGKHWQRLRHALETFGLRVRSVWTNAPGHATELAVQAVAAGAETVVAVGGDGTVCEVVEGLHQAGGGVLGILPVGTGNDVAKALGLPRRWRLAAASLRQRQERRADLLLVGQRVAVNAVGFGLLGAINQRAAALKKVRGMSAYLLATLATLARYAPPRIRVLSETFTYEGPMTILALQNGPTTGGGFPLAPTARPDDGLLDACLVGDLRPWARVLRLVSALRGTLARQPGSQAFSFCRLKLLTEPLPAHLDGNPWMVPAGSLEVRVLPAALRVRAPV